MLLADYSKFIHVINSKTEHFLDDDDLIFLGKEFCEYFKLDIPELFNETNNDVANTYIYKEFLLH